MFPINHSFTLIFLSFPCLTGFLIIIWLVDRIFARSTNLYVRFQLVFFCFKLFVHGQNKARYNLIWLLIGFKWYSHVQNCFSSNPCSAKNTYRSTKNKNTIDSCGHGSRWVGVALFIDHNNTWNECILELPENLTITMGPRNSLLSRFGYTILGRLCDLGFEAWAWKFRLRVMIKLGTPVSPN